MTTKTKEGGNVNETRASQAPAPAEADAQPQAAAEAKAPDDGFIKYVGHNGIRIIDASDWGNVGCDGQEGAQWDRTNAWRLPRERFSKEALNYLLNVDGEFAED